MSEGQYFAAESPEDLEWVRVGLIEEMCDGISVGHLEGLGVEPGWRCVEVGAGRGSIARWLAERVGPSGEVVAADLNPRLLRRAELPPNVVVREHDILVHDLEADRYDLGYCRALLVNVAKPAEALRRIAAAIRPGGWLCVEEYDLTAFAAIDTAYPGAEQFRKTLGACTNALRANGSLDSTFGRRTVALVEQLGFSQIGTAGNVLLGRGGNDPCGKFWNLTLRTPGFAALVNSGVVTRDEHEQACALLEDPAFTFVGSIQFSVWGQRSVN